MSHFTLLYSYFCSSPFVICLKSRLTEAHYCCQYVMPALAAVAAAAVAVARLGFWRAVEADAGAADRGH